MSEAEFRKWMYVYSVYPFGERAAMIANQNRDPKKSKPVTAQDFMPKDPFAKAVKPSKAFRADFLATFSDRIKKADDGSKLSN